MEISQIKKDAVFGVIGVCGVNGNLIARILSDNGYTVIANDMQTEENCRFYDSLQDYPDIDVYYGNLPEEFFIKSDYMILPAALIESKSQLYQKVQEYDIPIITVKDIFELFEPVHPVICITGTNGKTTTTTLLKHLAYSAGMNPCEHNLKGMQGNVADIPPLQARLHGDVNILETGTFGIKGSLDYIVNACRIDAGLITNITPDHLEEGKNFLDYANVKGEFVDALKNKTLIVNNDDPTIKGLLRQNNYSGHLITFGLECESIRKSSKKCFCNKDIIIDEFIAGVGKYECSCGIKYEKADYVAKDINDEHDRFILETPEGEFEFKLQIKGLHNIYNTTGAIILAHEILKIPYSQLQEYVSTFTGVNGRMQIIGHKNNKEIMIDYAHNPAGIITVLKELKNTYDSVINVITTSSESGIEGDKQILDCSLEFADYVVPASYNAYVCAKKAREDHEYKDKIILPDYMPDEKKHGTLGATAQQVLIGFKKALDIDGSLLVCTGEAAFKFKDEITKEI
ncbi:MAG: hypothetical protein E7Z86_07100 [Methanosphaera stadtmanae]|nr:hypothetical protein [Methanosphaera stadtmanae]